MVSARIDKGRLSFCFKSLGNSITDLFNIVRGLSGLFRVVRACSELFGLVRELTHDLTLVLKNLFHVIFKGFLMELTIFELGCEIDDLF